MEAASSNGNGNGTTTTTTTNICSHCDRETPSSNIDLHYAHCSRNLEKCKICVDMIPRKHAEEHYLSTHTPVSCSLCSETMEPRVLAVHEGKKCLLRIVTCDYCEFPLPAIDLPEQLGLKFVSSAADISDYVLELHMMSRVTSRARKADRARFARRPTPQDFSTRKLVFNVAITGIAVVIGSLIFQRKSHSSELR